MRFALQQLRETLQARFPAACSLRLPAGVLPTGEPRLDALLPGGGLPRGCLVELEGEPSSGKSELIDRLTAAVTVAGGCLAYVDLPGTYYPPAAAAAGACLERVLVVRPAALPQAIWACELLTRCQGFELIVADLTVWPAPRLGAAPLHRLARVAEQGQGVVLFVTEPPPGNKGERVLPGSVTATRLVAERRAGINDIRLERTIFRGPGAREIRRTRVREEFKRPIGSSAPEPSPGEKHVLSSPPEPVEGGRVEGFSPGPPDDWRESCPRSQLRVLESAEQTSLPLLIAGSRGRLSPWQGSGDSVPGKQPDSSTSSKVIPLQPRLERQGHDGRRR